MLLELKNEIIYGPVQSRRLGSSLGINILPGGHKVCTFNCLYCQYGWTDYSLIHNLIFPTVANVFEAVEKALQTLSPSPGYITFSGNGEPTLHPEFHRIVDEVIKLRDRYAPSSKTAILSNSTTAHDPAIRDSLEKLDVRIMKLDSGCEETLAQYNQPYSDIILDNIVEGLNNLNDVSIQALFTGGKLGNSNEKNISAWIKNLKQINPIDIHVYTLDRDCPSDAIAKLNTDALHHIRARCVNENIPASVY
jgi:wyosine [tRNA(Phe)-imidazoG37] synthetase (radical SAM superfamily)